MRSLEEFKKLSSVKREEDKVYGPDKDILYEQYMASRPKVAGGTVNPIISTSPKVGVNKNLEGRKSQTYAQALAANRAKASTLGANVPEVAKPSDNIRELIFGTAKRGGTINPAISAADFSTRYDSMTDRENAIFSYYKKAGQEKQASDFLKAIDMDMNQRAAEKRTADAKQLAEESTFGGLYARYMAGLTSPMGALYGAVQEGRGEAIDPNSPLFMGEQIRQGQTEGFVGESTGLKKAAKEAALGAFDWGTQVATLGAMGIRGAGLGAGNSALYGASAFGGNVKDATERGATASEAVTYGTVGAAAEIITEKMGFERLFQLGKLAKGRKGALAKEILRNMGAEGLEEGTTEAVNLIADTLILGDRSQMAGVYSAAKAQGMTEGQAAKEALLTAAKQIGYSGGVGALSGGLIAGGVAGLSRGLGRNALGETAVTENTSASGTVDGVSKPVENVGEMPENVGEMQENGEKSSNDAGKMKETTAKIGVAEATETQGAEALSEELEGFGEKYYGEKGKEVFLRLAKEKGNLDHTAAFNTYYRAGIAGIKESEIKPTAYTAGAEKLLLNEAYMAGAEDRRAEIVNAIRGRNKLSGKRGLILGEDVKATEGQMAITKLYADIGGAQIRLVNKIKSPVEGQKVNGYQQGDIITIALDADSFMGTMHHEMVHYIRKANPAGYDAMRELVFNLAKKSGIDMEKTMERYRSSYESVYGEDTQMADIMEEVVADAFQKIVESKSDLKVFLNELHKRDRTLFERIKDFLEKMEETIKALFQDNIYTEFAEELSKDLENIKALRKKFAEVLADTGKMEAGTQETQTGEKKYSITLGMTEEERYQELKDRSILVYSDTETAKYPKEFVTIEELQKTAKSNTRKEIKKLAEDLGILNKGMRTPEIEMEFILSGEGMRESFNKQSMYGGSYLDFAKAIVNLDKIMETAVLIEEHKDKYKNTSRENENLEKISVLFGAFQDEGNIIPAQMEIKKSSEVGGRLYMTVAMTKIEAGVIEARPVNTEPDSLLPASTYRLADIFREINVADKNFLKYVPDGFLNKGQKEAKSDALRAEKAKIERLRAKKTERTYGNMDAAQGNNKDGKVKFSFAGEKAWEANEDMLEEAKKMEREGTEKEEIFRKTGWFRGMDKKWRFEIDDSQFQFFPDGDAFLAENVEYQRLKKMLKKGDFDNPDFERLYEKYSDEFEGEKKFLGNYMQHEALFRNYPFMQAARIRFEDLEAGARGRYEPENNEIILDKGMQSEYMTEPAKRTLLHEMQHAIQSFEGFTGGSSIAYWEKQQKNGFSKKKNGVKMNAYELYQNTAGEIEARDTANRKDMTAEQRKEEFPDLGDENVVFIDKTTGENVRYSIRDEEPPKKTGVAYKVFAAKDGQLYPPMVANPGGEGTPVGVWLNADVGEMAEPSKTGRPQVKSGGKGTSTGKGSLAFRPGWHLGDIPLAKQFARKNPETGQKDLFPANFVWAECEYAMDVDYQEEAMSYGYTENGKFRHSYAGLPRLPKDGYYRYRTNPNPDTVPWIITGAMKVTRILTDAEADRICREAGVEPMQRQGGPIDLEKYGLKAGITTDVKFSIRKEEMEADIAENTHWKAAYEGLLREFEVTKEPLKDRESAKKVVRRFLKKIKSKYNEEEFLDRFVSLCNYGADMQSDSDYKDLLTACTMLAEDALRESQHINRELYDTYADLRKQLRENTLHVGKETLKELEAMGIHYNELRTKNFGRVRISQRSGEEIDTKYAELAEAYPELFKEDQSTSRGELLMDMIAVRESLEPTIENPYFDNMEEYAAASAYELLGMMNDVALEKQTFADKYEEKLRKLREENKQALQNAREQARNEKKLLQEKYATNAEARIEAVKQRYEKRMDRKEYWRLRKLAVKDAKALAEWLKAPTDKNHVPQKFKEGVETILALIQTEKPDLQIPLRSFVAMRGGLMELYGDKEGIYLYVERDEQVINILDRFIQKYPDGANLDTMDGTDMKYFRNLIASVKKACTDANRLHTSQREKSVVELSDGFIRESQKKKDAKETGIVRRINDFLGLEMLDANCFFKRIGGDVYGELWKGLRKGMDKKIGRWREAMDFINGLVDPKEVRKWTDAPAREFNIGGTKVYLTIPQIMSLACLMRRSQGRQHIIGMDLPTENGILRIRGGGFKAENLAKDKKAKQEKAKVVEPTEADIKEMIGTLTEEQARVAYAMQQYLSNEVADWGNETTMLLFGYEKFTTENYFPIVSDKNFVNQLVTKTDDIAPSLKSMGMTKNINQYANNPVIIQDIFKVFANHIDQMSNYNAFVASESDFNKFLNYKAKAEDGRIYSVKDEMDRTMGAGGVKYIKTLMNRLVTSTGLSDDSDFAKMFVRNMKVASVGANLRVIVQQPTAYLRAANQMSLKYLLNPAVFGKTDKNIIYKYAPIALWKSWGNYEMDTGKTMYEQIIAPTKFAWTKDKLMAGAGLADELTWSRLWNACVLETRDRHKGLSEEETYRIAGERFGEIVDESQVVDSILHRSQIMRKKGLYTQMATSFMSEPIKNFNMASNALVEVVRNNTPENRKKFMRCYLTIIASGVATACAAGLVDAMRDDDDEDEFLRKWKKAVLGDYTKAETPKDIAMAALSSNIADNLNPMGMIPYLRDAWSMIQGYDIKRTDFDWLNDILKSMKRWKDFIAGESEYTLSSMLLNTAGAVSKMAGIPIGSAERDLKAISNLIVLHIIGDDEMKYDYRKLSKDIGSEKNTAYYVERMLKAKFSGNEALATRTYNDMVKAGISNEIIDSRIETQEKKALKEEPAAAEAAEAYAAGDYEGYMDALDSLTEKGYGRKNAISVIESIYRKKNGEQEDEETFETITQDYWEQEGEDPAGYEMMFNAFMNGSERDYKEMWDRLEAAGKEDKSIRQSMRTRLKKAYQTAKEEGNYQEAQKAKNEFLRLGGKPETLEK